MSGYVFAVALTFVVLVMLFFLMRRRRIREKYAAVWIAMAIAVVVLGAFPRLAFLLSALVGVETPANLVFALAFVVLLLVCIQLSVEVSNLEEETRTIAEEHALLRLDVSRLRDQVDGIAGSDADDDEPNAPRAGGPTRRDGTHS